MHGIVKSFLNWRFGDAPKVGIIIIMACARLRPEELRTQAVIELLGVRAIARMIGRVFEVISENITSELHLARMKPVVVAAHSVDFTV